MTHVVHNVQQLMYLFDFDCKAVPLLVKRRNAVPELNMNANVAVHTVLLSAPIPTPTAQRAAVM